MISPTVIIARNYNIVNFFPWRYFFSKLIAMGSLFLAAFQKSSKLPVPKSTVVSTVSSGLFMAVRALELLVDRNGPQTGLDKATSPPKTSSPSSSSSEIHNYYMTLLKYCHCFTSLPQLCRGYFGG